MEKKSIFSVRNVLVTSYCLLWVISIVGVIFGSLHFGYGPVKEEPTTDIDPNTFRYENESFVESKTYREYMEYVYSTELYASYEYVPEFYVVPLCGTVLLFTSGFLAVLWLDRDLLKSTVGLYSSFAVLSMTVGFMAVHQNKRGFGDYKKFDLSYGWITAIHCFMLLLPLLQIVLSVVEIRRQKVSWPTIHFSHCFTCAMFLRPAILIMTVYGFIGYMITTFTGLWSSYDEPVYRFPAALFMPGLIACLYAMLVAFEVFVSLLFGHANNKMLRVGGLLAMACYTLLFVISLPPVTGHLFNYPDKLLPTLICSSVCLGLTLLQVILSFAAPDFITRPPGLIRLLAHLLGWQRVFVRRLRDSPSLKVNFVLMLLCLIALILLILPLYVAPVLALDVAIFIRTLTAFTCELVTGEAPNDPPVKITFVFVLENFPLVIATLVVLILNFGPFNIAIAVINAAIIIIQAYTIHTNANYKEAIAEMNEREKKNKAEEDTPNENMEEAGLVKNLEEPSNNEGEEEKEEKKEKE